MLSESLQGLMVIPVDERGGQKTLMALVVQVSLAISSYSMARGVGCSGVAMSPSAASSASTLISTSGWLIIMNLPPHTLIKPTFPMRAHMAHIAHYQRSSCVNGDERMEIEIDKPIQGWKSHRAQAMV